MDNGVRKIYCFHRGKIVLKTWYSPVVAHSQDTDFLDTQEGTENAIGSKFSDLASIIAQVKDKRVGVCLDTCKPIHFIVSHFDKIS